MSVEALYGMRGSFHPFIQECRPHPGQIESANLVWNLLENSQFAILHEEEVTIEEDEGKLRQEYVSSYLCFCVFFFDISFSRYSLRTAPQFLGPQLEALLSSIKTVSIELNSTTDNPLVDERTGETHHGGNFQAMAVTNAMEQTRLSLHHIGRLMFSQCAELM